MMLLECFMFGAIIFLMTGAQCEDIEIFANEGSVAVLPCTHKPWSSFPPAIIWSKVNKGTVWRKERSGLQYWGASWSQKGSQGSRIQCPHSQYEKGAYNLEISQVTEEDGGFYSCRLEFGAQFTESLVYLRIIKVTVSPPVPIWGRDVSVTCNVSPWPHGASVQWILNNSPFVPQTEIFANTDEAKSVVKEKATAKLSGNWTCVVSFKGKEARASATVSVKGIIQPSDDNTKVYAAVGSAVTLPCVFSNDLAPSSAVWEKLKPGSHFNPAPGRLPPSFSPSLSYSQYPWDRSGSLMEVRLEDEGRYRCSGIVEEQKLTRTMQLIVARIDRNMSKKQGSVTLKCQLSDTSDITDYEWLRVTYDLNGTKSVESIQKGKTLTISGVSEENQGEWLCLFYGKEGILGNVTHHVQLMSGLSGRKSSGSSHNTAAVVGLSFLLLVLLMILAQMYKNHQRRKRIFQYPALETIVHTISNEREERERTRVKK
ncbi:Lymphocyte activation gene 3 protein [Channa argus]|uniref:Lymphocyte activation gene 3 protein n=1 Tax=Channa argus TaxID=215402 RepID=A0A6G1PP40_CHAAH|nr:Lymphocyte activation gene 3 protein [Channa argus]KAK2910098.1 hypothetical protein Q8A73_007813 [Channa argus]